MKHRAVWARAAIVLALAGCQLPVNLGSAFRQAAFDALEPDVNGQSRLANGAAGAGQSGSAGATPAPDPGQSASPSASTSASASPGATYGETLPLSGTVRRPTSDLVSNNSAGLINTGGAVFFRLQGSGSGLQNSPYAVSGLERAPVAGAVVSLVGLDGTSLGDQTATTDAQGRFAFSTLPQVTGPYLARATFKAGGKDIAFESLIHPASSGPLTTEIDVASTFVSRKVESLANGGRIDPRNLLPPRILALIDLLRDRLSLGHLPFMGGKALDVLPMFDQLAFDDPEIRASAGAVTPEFTKPGETWLAETLLQSGDLARMGLMPVDAPPHVHLFGPSGTFAVDAAGDLYFPVLPPAGVSIKIFRVRPGTDSTPASGTLYAELPLGFLNPVSLTFSPRGVLHALAVEIGTLKVRVFSGAGQMQAHPGFVYQLDPDQGPLQGDPEGVNSRVLGRIAVDDPGNVYVAFPFAQFVGILRKGTGAGVPLAGAMNMPGFLDGAGPDARFRFPFSVAIGPGGFAYVADKDNRCIRRIDPAGKVDTIAGASDDALEYRNGRGQFARFGGPESLAFGPDGSLFVTDIQTRRIRRLSQDGSVFLVAGSGAAQNADGAGPEAAFFFPRFLTADGAGNLYLLDQEPPNLMPGSPPQPGMPPPPLPTEFIRRIRRP